MLLDLNINVFCVIRSAGERTAGACRELLEAELPGDRVAVVELKPFEAALRECYRLGIESGARWLVTVDADVLLMPGSVQKLVDAAESMPEHYVQVEGRIFDKIFGTYRQAGHRIYRTSLLPKALQLVPQAGCEIRPEYATLQEMGKRGHPSRRVATVVGIHDFEQWYRDLYRKAFVHARKHRQGIVPLLERASRLATRDDDFRVILKGVWDGLIDPRPVSIDTAVFTELATQALAELGLKEREIFALDSISDRNAWIINHMDDEAPRMDVFDMPRQSRKESNKALQRFRHLAKTHGGLRALGYSAFAVGESICRGMKQRVIKSHVA